jgi:hypothetical protein
LSTISPSIVNVSREQPLTEPTLADICLERAEEQLLILLLKQGMYDIYESRVVEQVSTMPARETLGLMPVRVDQYVANELLDNDIQFSKSIHEQIFEEYCQVAATATAPELIQRHFTTHEQKDMRDFAIRHLFNSDPEYSPGWEIRYDITIRTTKEHVTNLQKNVEDCINMLKLRKMEHYRETLQKELEQEHPDEVMEQILKTISLVNQRRKEIAEILGVVITR